MGKITDKMKLNVSADCSWR